jgi:O-antigen ligase
LTLRARALLGAGAIAVPLAFAPLALQPGLAIALVCGIAAVALAARSLVYPVAFAGLPSVAIGLAGGQNPLPQGVITVALAGWLAGGIVFTVARRDELPRRVLLAPAVVLTVLLAAWMLVRLGASLDPSYGSRKLQLFVSGNLLLLVAGALIAWRRERFNLYVLAALVMSLLSAVAIARGLLSGAQATVGGRFSLTAEDSPIGLGREAADGILLAVFILLTRRSAVTRLFVLAALPIIAVALIASGSRGPIVGLAVGFAALLLLNAGDPAARKRVALVLVGALGAVLLVPQLVPGQDVGRAFSIFSGRSQGLSSNGRTALWHQAWQLFSQHPLFGLGTGSFGFFQPDELFPHNLILETGAELGAVGAVLVALFLVASGWVAWRVWRSAGGEDRQHAAIVLALFAAAVVNAMLSSDITANDAVWLTGGLALGLSRRLDLALPSVAGMRALRRGRRGSTPPRPFLRAPTSRPLTIVAPVAGAQVSGSLVVEIAPGRPAAPIARLRLEWEANGLRTPVAERDEQPWWTPSVYRIDWDASKLPGGPGVLRAVAVDAAGRETESEPVSLQFAGGP